MFVLNATCSVTFLAVVSEFLWRIPVRFLHPASFVGSKHYKHTGPTQSDHCNGYRTKYQSQHKIYTSIQICTVLHCSNILWYLGWTALSIFSEGFFWWIFVMHKMPFKTEHSLRGRKIGILQMQLKARKSYKHRGKKKEAYKTCTTIYRASLSVSETSMLRKHRYDNISKGDTLINIIQWIWIKENTSKIFMWGSFSSLSTFLCPIYKYFFNKKKKKKKTSFL